MSIIRTNRANCKDCYKCVRSCPVKAIQVERSLYNSQLHARVVEDRCIYDGRCIAICPQKAKELQSEREEIRRLLAGEAPVWASLAPSYAAVFPHLEPGRIAAALRRLGFAGVQETALGAEMVAAAHARLAASGGRRPLISSSCPAVVNLIERYYPEALPHLAPVVSPMIAHARWLKKNGAASRVVFIGPCVAKYEEAKRPGLAGAVDGVLSFAELALWWKEAGINPESLPEEAFDGPRPGRAALFPLDGGLLRTAALSTDLLDGEVLTVSGVENCRAFLADLAALPAPPTLVEMMVCAGGCLNGPLMPAEIEEPYIRRQELLRRQAERRVPAADAAVLPPLPDAMLRREYQAEAPERPQPTEEELKAILARTGKTDPGDELNCGACGYGSCREKAVAVFQGMADPEMCLPYMRKRAESLSNLVFDSTPNGIIMIDDQLSILEMNGAAERIMGKARRSVKSCEIESLLNPDELRRLLAGESEMIRVVKTLPANNLVLQLTVVRAERENIALVLLEDITKERKREEELSLVKDETLQRAQEVIDKQMAVVQKVAGLLGETTAETKVILTKLMRLMRDEDKRNGINT